MGLVMGFERLDHVMKYSIYYELVLYPVGVWLAFKMTKTLFWATFQKNKQNEKTKTKEKKYHNNRRFSFSYNFNSRIFHLQTNGHSDE